MVDMGLLSRWEAGKIEGLEAGRQESGEAGINPISVQIRKA